MNFLLCNRCKKNSEENISNINSSEILIIDKNPKNANNNFTSMNKVDTSEKFQPLDDLNINNLEDDDDDDLKIIEYPYKQVEKKEKSYRNKIKPKEFKVNDSKFNENDNNNDIYLIEKDIINRLNYIDATNNLNKPKKYKCPIQLKAKNNISNDKAIYKKDTITDPSNLALSSLINDINNTHCKMFKIKTQKKEKKEKEEINTTENMNYLNKLSRSSNKSSNNQTKSTKYTRKMQKKEYSKHIINKKKYLLKNKNISNNILYKNNLSISNLIINTHKNTKAFPKSYSFNCFENGQCKYTNKIKTEANNKVELNINSQKNKKGKTFIFSPKKKTKFNNVIKI